ncbi:hypothetical protein MTR_3g451860 [Medicago truncatula]|uniref:Uncharacterized protein n=1 Tax=Medicago truncatula TaxID=3880 RepID=A0A072UXE5_MEDTR|nr:hypothetical protein MTR_3g451860 [Medicago truncatula]
MGARKLFECVVLAIFPSFSLRDQVPFSFDSLHELLVGTVKRGTNRASYEYHLKDLDRHDENINLELHRLAPSRVECSYCAYFNKTSQVIGGRGSIGLNFFTTVEVVRSLPLCSTWKNLPTHILAIFDKLKFWSEISKIISRYYNLEIKNETMITEEESKRANKQVGSYGILDFGDPLVNILAAAAITLKSWKIVAAIMVAGSYHTIAAEVEVHTYVAVRLEFCSNKFNNHRILGKTKGVCLELVEGGLIIVGNALHGGEDDNYFITRGKRDTTIVYQCRFCKNLKFGNPKRARHVSEDAFSNSESPFLEHRGFLVYVLQIRFNVSDP